MAIEAVIISLMKRQGVGVESGRVTHHHRRDHLTLIENHFRRKCSIKRHLQVCLCARMFYSERLFEKVTDKLFRCCWNRHNWKETFGASAENNSSSCKRNG